MADEGPRVYAIPANLLGRVIEVLARPTGEAAELITILQGLPGIKLTEQQRQVVPFGFAHHLEDPPSEPEEK